MREFKGTKQAEIYADGKSSSEVFKRAHITDFLAGYNKAIEDTSAPEMFEMLKGILEDGKRGIYIEKEDLQNIEQLITKITE